MTLSSQHFLKATDVRHNRATSSSAPSRVSNASLVHSATRSLNGLMSCLILRSHPPALCFAPGSLLTRTPFISKVPITTLAYVDVTSSLYLQARACCLVFVGQERTVESQGFAHCASAAHKSTSAPGVGLAASTRRRRPPKPASRRIVISCA